MNDEIVDGEAVELVGQAVELRQAHPPTLFRSEEPGEIIARASETAKTLADVLKKQKLTTRISQRDHVRVEGWTLLGTMLGVFPVCVWTRKLENGWEARVEARTISGAIVGAAEAECLRSEKTWANRDDFALRSMAQTRATSKALRQPLGFVVSLAGFDPTPFEEMPPQDSGAGHSETREVTPKDSTPTDATSSERTIASTSSPAPDSHFKAPNLRGKPTKAEVTALLEVGNELLAEGRITAAQLRAAARVDADWPTLIDKLDRQTVRDLTERLGRYRKNVAAA